MYVNPVLFGVFCTIGAELMALFIYALYEINRRSK